MVATCILPIQKGGLHIGGNDSIVVFLSNDAKFNLQRVVQLVAQKLQRASIEHVDAMLQKMDVTGSEQLDAQRGLELESITKECLSRLWVSRCKNLSEFVLSLVTLPRRLADISSKQETTADGANSSNANLAPQVTLFIDTIDLFAPLQKHGDADDVR